MPLRKLDEKTIFAKILLRKILGKSLSQSKIISVKNGKGEKNAELKLFFLNTTVTDVIKVKTNGQDMPG